MKQLPRKPIDINRSFLRRLAVLAMPVAIQMLLQSLLGMADILMVGSLGGASIASVGLAAKIHFFLQVTMGGIATASSVMVAQYYGAGDTDNIRSTVAMSLVIGVLSMLGFMLLFLFAAETVLSWINPDPTVNHIAAEYLRITAPTLIVTQVVIIYEASMRSLGQTTFSLFASAIVVIINIALNYILIFGHLGFDAMGVAGAAWATLISRCLQVLLFIYVIYRMRHIFALPWAEFVAASNWNNLKPYVMFSLPLVGNYVLWGIGNSTYHILTGYAGTDALAIMGILVPLEMTVLSIFLGIATASSVMIGQALGANDQDRAWNLSHFFNHVAIVIGVITSVSLWLGRDVFIGFYDNLERETLDLLYDVLTVMSLCIWLKILNLVRIVGILRAGGDNEFCLRVDSTVMWVIGLPIYAFAVFSGAFSFVTIYTLTFLEEAMKCIPVRLRLNSGKWLVNLTQKPELQATEK